MTLYTLRPGISGRDWLKLGVVAALFLVALYLLIQMAVTGAMPPPPVPAAGGDMRPALPHEIEGALRKPEIANTVLRNRILVAEKSFERVSGRPEVVIVPYGVRWEGLELGYTALLFKGPAASGRHGPYKSFVDARLFYKWQCFGELINVVKKGLCSNPDTDWSAASLLPQPVFSVTQEDAKRWFGEGVAEHSGLTTTQGDWRAAPRYEDWAYIVLQPGARVSGGSLGLNQVTTAERFGQPEARWVMLYDPFCEEVARETSGLNGQVPLRDLLPEPLLERYAPCSLQPIAESRPDSQYRREPVRPDGGSPTAPPIIIIG